jgi:hypothetical protein
MSTYDILLQKAKINVEELRMSVRSVARESIPRMFQALRDENPEMTAEDVRDRIERDCRCIWSNRTILEALPDEAKNPEKQRAGKLRRKRPIPAAEAAADRECPRCTELLAENVELKEALGKTTNLTRASEIDEFTHGNPQVYNLPFELIIFGEKVRKEILSTLERGSDIRIKSTIDPRTRIATASTLASSSALEMMRIEK